MGASLRGQPTPHLPARQHDIGGAFRWEEGSAPRPTTRQHATSSLRPHLLRRVGRVGRVGRRARLGTLERRLVGELLRALGVRLLLRPPQREHLGLRAQRRQLVLRLRDLRAQQVLVRLQRVGRPVVVVQLRGKLVQHRLVALAAHLLLERLAIGDRVAHLGHGLPVHLRLLVLIHLPPQVAQPLARPDVRERRLRSRCRALLVLLLRIVGESWDARSLLLYCIRHELRERRWRLGLARLLLKLVLAHLRVDRVLERVARLRAELLPLAEELARLPREAVELLRTE
mmetsp:Transcript_4016/g.10470  ORF Transcript_4016/g.10470 Transcript_4016/m.10470 type:complete len:286 (+) Transcript_4016:301-1158(+)